jgi:hypothetical protein
MSWERRRRGGYGRRTLRVVGGVCLCVAWAWGVRAWGQHPGGLEAFAQRLEVARRCHEVLDEGCVIDALEGPLLARDRLPEGLSDEDAIDAHELLGLAYLVAGFDAEGRRVFERLLRRHPSYRLTRPDLPPERSRLIEQLAEELRLRAKAQGFAADVKQNAGRIAVGEGMQRVAEALFARWQGRQFGLQTRARAARQAALMLSPPWGPLRGPLLTLSGGYQWLTGSDALFWEHGWGMQGSVALHYAPLWVRWSIAGYNHPSRLTEAQEQPLALLQLGASVLVGWRYDWRMLSVEVGGGAGIEVMYVGERLERVAPTFFGAASGLWWMANPVAVELQVQSKWVFGASPEDAVTVTSLSSTVSLLLGLCVAF